MDHFTREKQMGKLLAEPWIKIVLVTGVGLWLNNKGHLPEFMYASKADKKARQAASSQS